MSGVVKNGQQFLNAVDIWMNQYRGQSVEMFRAYVWAVFVRILEHTPQYTGAAVANWNLSIGSPNYDFDPSYGTAPSVETVSRSSGNGYREEVKAKHKMGNKTWINVAIRRAEPVWARIRARDKVFICNGILGDDGAGDTNFNYIEALQTPGPWQERLREIHKPYETVQESMLIVGTKLGRTGVQLPRVGGASWSE